MKPYVLKPSESFDLLFDALGDAFACCDQQWWAQIVVDRESGAVALHLAVRFEDGPETLRLPLVAAQAEQIGKALIAAARIAERSDA